MRNSLKISNGVNWFKISMVPIGLWLILQIILLSISHQINKLDKEIRDLKQKINQTYTSFGEERHLKDGIVIKQAEFLKLKSAFPKEQSISEVIKSISEQAKRNSVSVSSIKPGQIEPYIDSEGQEFRVLGSLCRCLPVRIQGRVRYKQLGEFLNSLKERFGFIVTVEELNIEKDKAIEPELRFEILINTYLMSTSLTTTNGSS